MTYGGCRTLRKYGRRRARAAHHVRPARCCCGCRAQSQTRWTHRAQKSLAARPSAVAPAPCPASQIPAATGIAAFNAAYVAARAAGRCSSACTQWTSLDGEGRHFHGPDPRGREVVAAAIREAAVRLVRDRAVRSGSAVGPAYVVLYDVAGEDRARQLAASLHAALHGDLEPLALMRPGPCEAPGAEPVSQVHSHACAGADQAGRRVSSPTATGLTQTASRSSKSSSMYCAA